MVIVFAKVSVKYCDCSPRGIIGTHWHCREVIVSPQNHFPCLPSADVRIRHHSNITWPKNKLLSYYLYYSPRTNYYHLHYWSRTTSLSSILSQTVQCRDSLVIWFNDNYQVIITIRLPEWWCCHPKGLSRLINSLIRDVPIEMQRSLTKLYTGCIKHTTHGYHSLQVL